MNAVAAQSSSASSSRDILGKWGSQFSDSLMGGVMDNAVQMLKTGVSSLANILPANTTLPATRIVDGILEGKSNADVDAYLYLDPRSGKRTGPAPSPKTKQSYGEAVVVVIGGGNYTEYHNLQEYGRKQLIPRSITYGATELLSPAQFVQQLEALGAVQSQR